MKTEIHGQSLKTFEPVREAFARNFDEGLEAGARVAIVRHGEPLVDLWAGEGWRSDTLTTVFSATKGVAALAVAMLVDRGLLHYDSPVARYWPAFARHGKDSLTVAQLLSHQAGLPVIDAALPPGTAENWDHMVRALEEQQPLWPPGTQTGYHAVTFSWLVGELARRVTDRSLGTFVHEQIAAPLGLDFWIGAPALVDAQVAAIVFPADLTGPPFAADSIMARSMSLGGPPLAPPLDSRRFRAMELCSTNGLTHAGAMARLYGVLAAGGAPLLSGKVLDESTCERVSGIDAVVGDTVRRGCGWMLATGSGRTAWGPGTRRFGHTGAGGALGFADPECQIGFAYTPSRIRPATGADARWQRLIEATYTCLG